MADFFNISIPIPVIWGLVGLLEFCIVFVYIHEKPLPLFPTIPIFSASEKIHCGLTNLPIIDPAKTANNCSIVWAVKNLNLRVSFEFRITFRQNFCFFCCFKQVFWHKGICFCLKSNNRLLLVVSVFTSWLFDFIRY